MGFDPYVGFYHDVPRSLAEEAMSRGRHQSDTPGNSPWPLEAWPDVPTRFVLCRWDRLLPAEFLRRVVRERLGIDPDEIDAGHCVALSRPGELASVLEQMANWISESRQFLAFLRNQPVYHYDPAPSQQPNHHHSEA